MNINKIKNKLKQTSKYIVKRLKTITPFESFVLISIFALTILLVKYFKIKETEINVRLQVWDYPWPNQINPYTHKVPDWKADSLKVNQTEFDSQGKQLAKIIDIQKFDGNTEGSEVYLTVKLKVDYNKVTKQFTFKNKTVDLGGFIELKIDNIIIFGKIINNDITKNKNQEVEMKTVWKNLRLRYSNAPFWIADKLSVGQKTFDSKGEIIAEITDIESYEQSVETSDIYLEIRLKTTYDEKSRQYMYADRTINLSNLITLQFNNIAFDSQIINNNLPDDEYKKKEINITAKWSAVEQWQINQMKVGEKMLDQAKNETIAEILSIRTQISPNTVFVSKETGEINYVPNPTKKDVYFKIRIKGFESNNKLFFAGHQRIKAGDSITILGKDLTYYLMVQSVDRVTETIDTK